jgi:hypothetical protein
MTNPAKYLPNLARKHADEARPRKSGKWLWTEAMDRAPWSKTLPTEHETAFRRAYAERLVERGLALPAGRSRVSGKTDLKPCKVYLSSEEFELTSEIAKAAGLSWSTWARRKLTGGT